MEIIWSDMALHQLDGILDYVEEHFGASVSRKTLDDINSKVGRLLLFPESGTPDYSYSSKLLNDKVEPTLKSKACLKCLYFTKIISALCCYLEYFSYLYTIN